MKNYVEKRGLTLPSKMVIETRLGKVQINDPIPVPTPYKGMGNYVMGTQLDNSEPARVLLRDKPELVKEIERREKQLEIDFLTRYPGIDELLSIINNNVEYGEQFQEMMEDEGNDGVFPPSTPKMSIEDGKKRYPIAAAYLAILAYADADPSSKVGSLKYTAGDRAIERIRQGQDVMGSFKKMKEKFGEELQTVVID